MKADYTKRKFLTFSSEQQHKICAEVLRSLYGDLVDGISSFSKLNSYNEMAEWLKMAPLEANHMQSMADRYHQHLTLAKRCLKEHNLLPSIRKGDRAEAEAAWPITIYLDKIRSAHNLGSILRTVEAFSLGKVYLSGDMPFVDHKQVQDAAMGASKWIECRRDASLESLPRPIIAMETSASAISLYDFIFPETFTLVMGNEEYGCSDSTLQIADVLIEIPMRGHKNSLNVANAFAIAAAEICRQKLAVHKHQQSNC